MRNFATLFDVHYLPQGLALYESLMKHSSQRNFTLYVLPMDRECERILKALPLPHLEIVNREFFEDALGMDVVKANRSFAEYCYTAASCLCEYVILRHDLSEISYVDADCWFAADPEAIFAEIGTRSIGIIPHRFAEKDRPRLAINGEYNVSLVHFKATATGRECLQTWARACRNWCYLRNENGKYADQGFLNDWPSRHGEECCVIQNIGVGCAPWNLQQYSVTTENGWTYVDGQRLIMYHAHEFRDNRDGTYRWTNYPLRAEDGRNIYRPYEEAVRAAKERIGALQAA